MVLKKEILNENYIKIMEDVKKYSPYPERVKILFVSKYFNLEEQKNIIEMGFNYFGENRAQIYRDKIVRFNKYECEKELKWDFIGRLQKNKIKYIIDTVNLIHSIDSYELLEEIDKKARERNKIVNGLIQINISKEMSKTGIYIEEFNEEFEKYFTLKNVKIKGFMTMAPIDSTENQLNYYFKKMLELKNIYADRYEYLEELSMGMSNDYIQALLNGATIIRIGSKLFENN